MKFKKVADKLYEKLVTGEREGYYKKKRVYPWLDKDGSIKWFNFVTGGSWIRLGITIGIIALIIGSLFEWGSIMSNYGSLVEKIGNSESCKHLLKSGSEYIIDISNFTLG